ncbi:MAG: 30S ribosomal protein S12 methylthiotransferase RimO [Planctomycetota bacterium]|nr:30S ribosomal protein S12 methylthiotransferase RimO [Planctomycetota bacterium]
MSDHRLVSLVHLGCARNLIDSELILGRMAEEGLVVTDDPEGARAVVVNTCSFIGPAREESLEVIHGLLERKRRGEIGSVVVAGCLVQRYRRKLREELPEVDLFAEISDYTQLARSVRELTDGQSIPDYLEGPVQREARREGGRLLATPASYAFLRISHGCDHQCSFCTIPSIRGPHRSKSLEDLLEEGRELSTCGARELVLVAEDSTAWGRDAGRELPELVEALADLPDILRVRVMYAYPNRLPEGLAPLLRDHPRVATYLDMPIQHAATPVLRAMRRHGSGEQVRTIVEGLLEGVPGLTLRTTLLVGFPGEREEDVEELCRFLRDYRLTRVGAFPYSDEEGTASHELSGRLPAEEVLARTRAVLAVRDELLRAAQAELVGREIDVLVDEADRGHGAVARAETDAPEVDTLALVAGSSARPGDCLRVRVEGIDDEANLLCEPCVTAMVDR